MRKQPRRRVIWLAVGCCLLAASSGCWPRPRHGVIFRGDFALELNRIPWMTGRGEEYEHADCVEAGCVDSCQAATCAGQPCGSRGCKRVASGAEGGAASAAAVSCYNEPRFFPVPTRPVFSPRDDLDCPPMPTGRVRQPETSRDSGDAVPIESQRPRVLPPPSLAPEPEEVPAPPGEKPSAKDANAGSAEPTPSGASLPKWQLAPPKNASKQSPPTSSTSRDTWPLRR